MPWPTRLAESANNFLDHFTSIDTAKWGTVTSGTGSVSVSDSNVAISAPANSAAFVYYKTKLSKTTSQLWLIAMNRTTGTTGNPAFWLMNGASAPTADTAANIDAKTIMARAWGNQSSLAILDWYYTSGGTQTYWSGSAWTSTYSTALNTTMPIRNNDYYILGLEIDGPNSRFRIAAYGKTYVAGYTFDQGLRLFGLSDWINFSAARSNADIWLVFGQAYNNDPDAKAYSVEWVRYCEQGSAGLIEGWTASKAALANGHTIRHHWSYDGKWFMPEDRSTNALSPTGAGWESNDLQCPNVVRDGTTDYLFYFGTNSVNLAGIGVAKATATATNVPQNGPWTRGASNPVISAQAGETATRYFFAWRDNIETDATKRWKCIYGVVRASDGKEVYKLATAPDPPDTSTWTYRGEVIGVGAGGTKDEGGVLGGGVPGVVYYGGQLEVYYTGIDASGNSHLLRAYGPTSAASLTKDNTTDRFVVGSATQSLTANLTGRTVTVADTTGFVQDGMVILDQDANLDNWSTSRVRKVVSSTQLELYHGLDGFTTATPAKIRQLDSTPAFGGQEVWQVGSEWWAYMTEWNSMQGAGASYGALCEQNFLYRHSAAAPSGAVFAIDHFYSPVTHRGFNNDLRSVENMGLLRTPLVADPTPVSPSSSGQSAYWGTDPYRFERAARRKAALEAAKLIEEEAEEAAEREKATRLIAALAKASEKETTKALAARIAWAVERARMLREEQDEGEEDDAILLAMLN